ncbi:MAG: hypothetical protein OER88_10185, partial [Planctomycetota bacterium]|nr:hypothetical protein [Planctomycetota bacterium]
RHGLPLTEVRGVIAIGGAYDMVKYHALLADGLDGQTGLGKKKADAHLEWIFGESREGWVAASPATYLKGCAMPMLIVAEKGAAMRRYSQDFEDACRKVENKSIRFMYTTDRTHGQSTPMMSRKRPDPVRDAMVSFIFEHVR